MTLDAHSGIVIAQTMCFLYSAVFRAVALNLVTLVRIEDLKERLSKLRGSFLHNACCGSINPVFLNNAREAGNVHVSRPFYFCVDQAGTHI